MAGLGNEHALVRDQIVDGSKGTPGSRLSVVQWSDGHATAASVGHSDGVTQCQCECAEKVPDIAMWAALM